MPKVNGLFDFTGSEQGRVFDHLLEMSEFGLRFRCSCQRDYDDEAWFRTLNRVQCRTKSDLDNLGNGIIKHSAFRKCRHCQTDFDHRLDIPDTTWMLPVYISWLKIRDVAELPRLIVTTSKPTERPEDEKSITWRLAYISAIQPIPYRAGSNHLVSLQFLYRQGTMTRFYYESTDGVIHPDSPSERLMTDGQLLKKKCNDVIINNPNPTGKDLTRRPQFAVYFRIA